MFFNFFKLDKGYKEAISNASILGLHMVSGPIVGGAAGYYADGYFGTKPWLLLVGLAFGIAAGIKLLLTDTRKVLRNLDNASKEAEKAREEEWAKEAEESDDNGN